MAVPILEIRDFNVRFRTPDGDVHAVKHANLTVNEGECLGVVGESGSGKSQLFLATIGLLASNGQASGSVRCSYSRASSGTPQNTATSTGMNTTVFIW